MSYYILDYTGDYLGRSGTLIGTGYSLTDACMCGTGVKYTGLYRIDVGKNETADFFVTLERDFIISENLYEILLNQGCKVDFMKTEDKRGRELPFRLISSDKELPQVSYSPTLRIEPLWHCLTCKKNGWLGNFKMVAGISYALPFALVYKNLSKDFLNSSDVFITWEKFGKTNKVASGLFGVGFARPLIIVSDKLKNILLEFSDDLGFEQIVIE